MITEAKLVDVLRDHGRRRNIRDIRTHCLCGWISNLPNGAADHLHHQAKAVLAAIRAGGVPKSSAPSTGRSPSDDD